MAKSARASCRKSAKRNIRAKVFDSVAAERTERLSQKLLELASQPKPEKPISANSMEVDEESTNKSNQAEEGRLPLLPTPPASPLRFYSALHVPPSFLEWSSDDGGSEEEEEFYMQLGFVPVSVDEDEEMAEMSS